MRVYLWELANARGHTWKLVQFRAELVGAHRLDVNEVGAINVIARLKESISGWRHHNGPDWL